MNSAHSDTGFKYDQFYPTIGGVEVECHSAGTNQAVAFVLNPHLNDIGRARPGMPPTIELNPVFLQQLPAALQLFWYGHECAHHVLGHTIGNISFHSEAEADCWSISTLRDQGLATEYDVQRFAPYFVNNPGSPWGHLPGPQRQENFLACYRETPHDDEPTSVELPNFCCTQAGKLGSLP